MIRRALPRTENADWVRSPYRLVFLEPSAKPGDVIQLFATGLVPTPSGALPVSQGVSGVTVTIGTVTVPADFAEPTGAAIVGVRSLPIASARAVSLGVSSVHGELRSLG